ncbi:glycoside hydrolase family 2 TIM barrel-domain containing protein [Flexithrix dorotheae]|uniref:glycoside hydrolase family 2 TIM barrel-domain containing protein n=1 Tax=Flexithrix dorotheae TaxID=70993 RepID=UPI00036BD272|nr:glycoside hydrolase family 2 TIM barrel-domain containing protein [Flexithrix dorotheae]
MTKITVHLSFIRKIILFCCALLATHQISAQHEQRLNKNWEFLKSDLGGIWEAIRPVKAGRPETVPLWTEVELPHSFNAEDAVNPDVNYYQGPGWYRTLLSVSNPYLDGRVILHFEGAGQKTEVYIYDQKVGSHVGGYDEWSVDITDALEGFFNSEKSDSYEGKVPLSIRCDNSRDLQMIPSDLSDFNVYGGLYRYVNLIYKPAVFLENVKLTPVVDSKGKKGVLKINPQINNAIHDMQGNIDFQLISPDGKTVKQEKYSIEEIPENLEFEISKPALWSPENPQLYSFKTTISSASGKDISTEKIGFRHFEFLDKGPFHLNGERLLLRGTHRHEDHAGTGPAMTEAMLRKEMVMMKEIGINFIRLGHYQQSSIVLDLCDSLGILVWEEIPWCRGGLGNEVYKTQAKRMLKNMIRQHGNHPSVIIWGLGNENDWPGDFPEFDKEKIREFMKILNDLSHKEDPTRKTAIRRCDFCKDIVDVYSPSIWAGWYRGKFTDYQKVSRNEMEEVKHFLHVEWGASSHARRHSEDPDKGIANVQSGQRADERSGDASLVGGAARVSKDGDWSETYACNLIDWHLKEQEKMPWLTGTAYWPFKDFSTPVRPENPVPYVNQKGIVERDFAKKESFYVFQSYWTEQPMLHIYGHTWPVRWGEKGEEKLVKVYSNCEEAELFLNGKSYGKKKRDSQDYPAAGLRWPLVFQEGENTVKVVGKKGKTTVEDEISFIYQTEKWTSPTQLELEVIEKTDELTWVEVVAKDKNGVLCLDAKNLVTFSLVGVGRLRDDMGTSSGASKVQLYNGRARIGIYHEKGENIVSVIAEDIPPVFLNLEAK